MGGITIVAGIESWENYGCASAQSEFGCWAVEWFHILVKAYEDFGELPDIVFEVEVASDYGHTTTHLHHRVFQISELVEPPIRKYPYKYVKGISQSMWDCEGRLILVTMNSGHQI